MAASHTHQHQRHQQPQYDFYYVFATNWLDRISTQSADALNRIHAQEKKFESKLGIA